MSNFSTPLPRDLVVALTALLGAEPTMAQPAVVIASYLDQLAKGHGLYESMNEDGDVLDRVQLPEPATGVIEAVLGTGSQLDAESVRNTIYRTALELADDPVARRVLNQNAPLTTSGVLHLIQIYWNLEARDGRDRLPIKPDGNREIPVPGFQSDFAEMTWTARVNQKASRKSAGQSFRTQGARAAVLLAQRLADRSSLPGIAPPALEVRPTNDAELPLEIVVKGLAEKAWLADQFADALDLSTSYLEMIKRRAGDRPLDLETDLAEAFLMRGAIETLRPQPADGRAIADLEHAARSFATLHELEPQTGEHGKNLVSTWMALGLAHEQMEQPGRAVDAWAQAVDVAERISMRALASGVDFVIARASLRDALSLCAEGRMKLQDVERALVETRRAVEVADSLVSLDPDQSQHRHRALAIKMRLTAFLIENGNHAGAVDVAEATVQQCEDPEGPVEAEMLPTALWNLQAALSASSRHAEAIVVARRVVAVRESLLQDVGGHDQRGRLVLALLLLDSCLVAAGEDNLRPDVLEDLVRNYSQWDPEAGGPAEIAAHIALDVIHRAVPILAEVRQRELVTLATERALTLIAGVVDRYQGGGELTTVIIHVFGDLVPRLHDSGDLAAFEVAGRLLVRAASQVLSLDVASSDEYPVISLAHCAATLESPLVQELALSLADHAVELAKALVARAPRDQDFREALVAAVGALTVVLLREGRGDEANQRAGDVLKFVEDL